MRPRTFQERFSRFCRVSFCKDLTLYTYDKYNRLTKVKNNSSTATYQYNAQGYRTNKTVDGKTTNYLYNGDKVVLETNSSGKQTAFQAYGSALLYRKASGDAYYYLYNAHGDVTALIDGAGTIAATYDYDAFGNVTDKTGNVDNHITYAGYQMDDETGLYYLNARYYDSEIARFITEDSYTGEKNDPLTLNLYTYCQNNPIIYDDPSGHMKIIVSAAALFPLVEKYEPQVQEEIETGFKVFTGIITGWFGIKTAKKASSKTNSSKSSSSATPAPAPANPNKDTTNVESNSSSSAVSSKNNPAPGNPPAQVQSASGTASPGGNNKKNNKDSKKADKPTSKTFGKPIETTIGGKKVQLRVDAEPDANKIQIQAGHGKDSIVDIRIDPTKPLEPQIPKNLNLSNGQKIELLKYLKKAVEFLLS